MASEVQTMMLRSWASHREAEERMGMARPHDLAWQPLLAGVAADLVLLRNTGVG